MEHDGADLTWMLPLWRRVANIERAIRTVREATPAAEILLMVSADDRRVQRVAGPFAMTDELTRIVLTSWPGGSRGDYGRKINAGFAASSRPFVFLAGDDVVPHPGWYAIARELCVEPVGVVGTVDLTNWRTEQGEHSTHSLVARWYGEAGATMTDGPGVIYHEGYWHEYCDDEMIRTAMHRGAYAHAFGAIVEHLHPARVPGIDDDTYRRGQLHSRESRLLYMRRRSLWGDAGNDRITYPRRRQIEPTPRKVTARRRGR